MGEYTPSALCTVAPHLPAVLNTSCFTVGGKTLPGLASSTWKDVLKGTSWREQLKKQSYVAQMLSNASRHLDAVINVGGKWANKHIENKDQVINTEFIAQMT